jgi:hypothetical protein
MLFLRSLILHYRNFSSELPTAPPEIGGGARNYAYGDELNLNCTSKPSYPPTRLTWYVGGAQTQTCVDQNNPHFLTN